MNYNYIITVIINYNCIITNIQMKFIGMGFWLWQQNTWVVKTKISWHDTVSPPMLKNIHKPTSSKI